MSSNYASSQGWWLRRLASTVEWVWRSSIDLASSFTTFVAFCLLLHAMYAHGFRSHRAQPAFGVRRGWCCSRYVVLSEFASVLPRTCPASCHKPKAKVLSPGKFQHAGRAMFVTAGLQGSSNYMMIWSMSSQHKDDLY